MDLIEGRERIIAEKTVLAVQKSQFMSQWFGTTILTADYVLRDLSGRIAPGDLIYPDPDPAHRQRLQTLLQEKLATLNSVAGITIYDRNCIFLASHDGLRLGFRSNQRVCSEPGAPVGRGRNIQYVPSEKSASKSPVILISRHVVAPDGTLQGGVLAAIELARAQDWITSFAVETNDVLAIVDGDGTLLARNPPLPESIGKRAPTTPGQPSFGATRSSASFVAVSPLDGRERIFGMSKIEDIPLLIIVGFDKQGVLREWRRRAWQLSGGFLALLALTAMVLRAHTIALGQREQMRKLATTDMLTGVANRRQLVEVGMREFDRSRRYRAPLSALMVDIDRFKSINDTWGHPTGDRAIQALANVMVAAVRDQDEVGRLGGEEFAAILPETGMDGAIIIAERLRRAVQEDIDLVSEDGQTIRFTVSVGVATLSDDIASFDDLMSQADRMLYKAKDGGRNQVVADVDA
ncbi:GGDEF domain-containing protein [Paramagnetospirillum kuznetsovii]|uniref:diguanylate cyclase n=2 Tax=Paramagnetospirillum kuznetsovii TaxID=2053833 RepID=A0A364P051_9PROT|nr:GGDEF domain-containing protein [Paramagnetospirillum kuznetsovii]